MRALADTVPLFAPEVEVLTLPAWDCLPYDRTSPALRVMAERLATLNALQAKAKAPQLLIATENAATQRLLTPFRIRQLTQRIEEGERIDRNQLIVQLNALGYERVESVAEHGEYAVRGSLIDLFPAGETHALRLDFFGDEIESLRRFDPADQRSTDRAKAFTLMPASEALLDEETIKRFRSRYRETFGATATGDPLYEAVSDGRRMSGMEHWLPLFEERLTTLFDHLGENDLILRDAGVDQALAARREAIDDYYANRRKTMAAEAGSYRPLEPATLYHDRRRVDTGRRFDRPIHLTSPFPEPESDRIVSFGVEPARDFAPERTQQANVYEAVAAHVGKLRKSGHKVVLASYTRRRARAAFRPARRSRPQVAEAGRQLAGSAREQDAARADGPAARPWLHRAGRRRPHRAGHARRPARPPAQEAQGRRGLPLGARDAHAGRPRRPQRPWHRPLRGADIDQGRQGAARLRRARICRRQQALRSGREYRPADPLRQRERRRGARPPRRRSMAAAQVADEGADPRDCGRAHQDRRDARHAARRRHRAGQRLSAVRRPLPL